MSAEVLPSRALTVTQLRVLDQSLARIGRGAAMVRLRVGEALDRLAKTGGCAELGFSSMTAYARERCERGARWAADSRTLARRLLCKDGRGLPMVRRALMEGTMLWSMAELLSSHATAESEAEVIAVAKGRTVRQMKVWLAEREGGDGSAVVGTEEEEGEDERVLRIGVGFNELAIVEATRILVERLDGEFVTDERLLEAMLGEGESALLALEKRRPNGMAFDEAEEYRLRREALSRQWRARTEAQAEGRIPGVEAIGVAEEGLDSLLGSTPVELDAEIRGCCALLARRDLEMGRLCRVMFERKGWDRLGYASEAQYARERVGVSLSSLRHRCTLARRADALPGLAAALESGALGYEATLLVGRVATEETVDAWIERAKVRTLKHLREEVAAVELRARLGEEGSFLPPGHAELEEVAALERAALGGGLFAEVLQAKPPGRQISVLAGAGRELRLRVSAGLLAYFQRLRTRFERVAPPEASFIAFLGLAVWDAWLPAVRGMVGRWLHVYRRDRYRCCSPVCTRRDVTPHHLRFQSHGGGDEDENVVSLCSACHLDGIHQGRLRASPPASRIRWLIGRDPIMVVDGRERRLFDMSKPAS
jgi:hypothetical protein